MNKAYSIDFIIYNGTGSLRLANMERPSAAARSGR
jgi:hypothetical protein